jgi:hypothetical protein
MQRAKVVAWKYSYSIKGKNAFQLFFSQKCLTGCHFSIIIYLRLMKHIKGVFLSIYPE